jgi:hypothetical protein
MKKLNVMILKEEGDKQQEDIWREEVGENCITRSFITCTIRQVKLE